MNEEQASEHGLRDRLSSAGEDALGELAQNLLENPVFNQALAAALGAGERALQAQRSALTALNIPSAGDLERIERRVRSVSDRIEEVEDRLDDMAMEIAALRKRVADAALSAPAPSDAARDQERLSVPNPGLENETSVNVDFGFKARAVGLGVEATYFHNRIDDFITFVPGTFMGESEFGGQPVTTVGNVGEARIRGLEAEIEHRGAFLGGMRTVFAALSWNDGDDRGEDEPLFVPPLKLALGLGWTEGSGRVSGLVTGRFVDGQSEVPEGFDPTSGFAVFDLHAAADISALTGRPLVLRAGVENLLDRAYEEPYGAALAPGRNLVLSLEAGFGDRGSR